MNNLKTLKRLCENIKNGRFNWEKYLTPQKYYDVEIAVIPLHCSYGQIGYTIYFPFSTMPEIQYDWELNELLVDETEYQTWITLNDNQP